MKRWSNFVHKHPIPANCFLGDACCRFAVQHRQAFQASSALRQALFSLLHCWWNASMLKGEEVALALKVADGREQYP